MSPAIWICIYLPLILMIINNSNQRKQQTLRRIRRKKGANKMTTEMLLEFIGKECILYLQSGQISGTIESAQDGWLRVKVGTDTDLINLEYVSRIRKHPRKKNGKKATIVLD